MRRRYIFTVVGVLSPLWNKQTKKLVFSEEEISLVIKQIKNIKSAGRNGIKAELLKYGAKEIAKKIGIMFSEIACIGKYPREIVQRIITAIQNSGNRKGPVDQSILLVFCKLLGICLKKFITPKY